ncbi:hypothetical protein [Halorientalis halophila]|uniref:hypothetical protein n=1 Tax=Halorientalis halophila TaxID=3108499 RepID=UPI0030081D85
MLVEQLSGFVGSILIGAMLLGSVAGIATLVLAVPSVTTIAAVSATLALVVLFVGGLSAAGTLGSGGVSNPYW